LSISQNNLHDSPNQNDIYQHYNSQQRRHTAGLQLAGSASKFGSLHTEIPLNEFPAHVEHLKQNNNELFIKEFESIETDQHFTWEHSNLEVNKPKNRYANIVAYDHSRVVLSTTSRGRARGDNLLDDLASDLDGGENDELGSDYINANYIDGFYKQRAYIATQGPLPETFEAFWRMIWEERSSVIVMLTK
jgi:netrin-G3 ligand